MKLPSQFFSAISQQLLFIYHFHLFYEKGMNYFAQIVILSEDDSSQIILFCGVQKKVSSDPGEATP